MNCHQSQPDSPGISVNPFKILHLLLREKILHWCHIFPCYWFCGIFSKRLRRRWLINHKQRAVVGSALKHGITCDFECRSGLFRVYGERS